MQQQQQQQLLPPPQLLWHVVGPVAGRDVTQSRRHFAWLDFSLWLPLLYFALYFALTATIAADGLGSRANLPKPLLWRSTSSNIDCRRVFVLAITTTSMSRNLKREWIYLPANVTWNSWVLLLALFEVVATSIPREEFVVDTFGELAARRYEANEDNEFHDTRDRRNAS